MASYTACDIMSKKTLGLKQYKRMQKEKKLAKRTAATQEAKGKIAHSAFTAVVGASDVMSIKTSSSKQEPMIVTFDPAGAFDIVAYRKAMEAVLYERMETPLEMLIRCKYQMSLDAEYNIGDYESTDVGPPAACLDDNGFEMMHPMSSSDTHYELAVKETRSSLPEDVNAEEIVICLPCALEVPQRSPISLNQLFTAAAVKETMGIASPQKAVPSKASYPHWVDPAIVGYKIKQQAPGKSGIPTSNSSRAMNQHGEGTKDLDNRSSLGSVSTPNSSPTKTQRSYTSSPSESSRRSFTPPTPLLPSPAQGYWAHYPQRKPCNIIDWSRPHIDWDPLQ